MNMSPFQREKQSMHKNEKHSPPHCFSLDQPDFLFSYLLSHTGKSPEDAAREFGSLLLRRDLLVRCTRKFLKPPPGMTRLAKFPKKVILVKSPDSKNFAESDFYAWRFEPPVSPMVYLLSALAAVAVLLVCLFPVAPPFVKKGVVYFLLVLLCTLVGLLVVRAIVAAVSWIGTGRTVWILPNVLADDKPLSELFNPVIAVQEPDLGKKGGNTGYLIHLLLRMGTAAVLGGVIFVLYTKSPGSDKVRESAFKYRDDLFEMLNVHGDQNLLTKGNGTAAAAAAVAVDEVPLASSSTPNATGTTTADADHIEEDVDEDVVVEVEVKEEL